MRRFIQWARRKRVQRTPTLLLVLIISFLVVDLILFLVLVKERNFQFSKTWGEYTFWVGTIITSVTGSLFWPLLLAIVTISALIKRRKLPSLQAASFTAEVLIRIEKVLEKLGASVPVLGVECVLLLYLVSGIASAPSLAPPRPGPLVIPADPRSQVFYMAEGSGVAIYPRGLPGNTPLSRIEFLQLPDITPPQPADSNWRGRQEIAVSIDESRIYATDPANGLVYFIGTQPRLNTIGKVYAGKSVGSLALSADGKKLYVAVVQPCPPGGK